MRTDTKGLETSLRIRLGWAFSGLTPSRGLSEVVVKTICEAYKLDDRRRWVYKGFGNVEENLEHVKAHLKSWLERELVEYPNQPTNGSREDLEHIATRIWCADQMKISKLDSSDELLVESAVLSTIVSSEIVETAKELLGELLDD